MPFTKNLRKELSSKYSQKLFGHANESKRAIQKIAEATRDLIGNKIAAKITSVSKISSKNNSETHEEKILREKYIPS